MNTKMKNPYKFYYVGLAIICCLALGAVLLTINYASIRRVQRQYDQKKAERIVEDLENQMELFQEAAMKIAIDNEYQPYYFRRNKYNERKLLDDFRQYIHYSALTEECFLYYGDWYIFHSEGNIIDLNIYLKGINKEERGRLLEALTEAGEEEKVLALDEKIYICIPFRVVMDGNSIRQNAFLCFVVTKGDLEERFRMVGGGIDGAITLYCGEESLYNNRDLLVTDGMKNVVSSGSKGDHFRICYQPDNQGIWMNRLLPVQFLLILIDVAGILFIANVFANKSYEPLLEMSSKWRKKVTLSEEAEYRNAVEEIDQILDSMLRSNVKANLQIEQKQEMLKRQFLQLLLDGNYSFNVEPYLGKLQINLPGPFFYVISVSFRDEKEVTEKFLNKLSQETEQLSSSDDGEYVYAICDHKKRRFSVLCSIASQEQKEELTEYIIEVAESFGHHAVIGVGNVYKMMSRIHASWLESMDNLHQKLNQGGKTGDPQEYAFDPQDLRKLCAALAKGDEQGAVEEFEHYIKPLEKDQISMLMQQYIFSDLLSEITRQARRSHVELSNQDISLILAANNVNSFKDAALKLIHNFCERLLYLKNQAENDKSYQVYEYINAHFAEYDLSIEKTAADLNMSTAAVRQAIIKHTGRMYKDYLIYLRIEYAKELLLKEDMTVADTCQKVGYGNISYFIKLFKEMNGVTPAKYKENIRKKS